MPPSLLHRAGLEATRSPLGRRCRGVSPRGRPGRVPAGLGRRLRDPCNETVWADSTAVDAAAPVMARPGTLLALTDGNGTTDYSAQARALGAATYTFNVQLKRKVGTPDAPAGTRRRSTLPRKSNTTRL